MVAITSNLYLWYFVSGWIINIFRSSVWKFCTVIVLILGDRMTRQSWRKWNFFEARILPARQQRIHRTLPYAPPSPSLHSLLAESPPSEPHRTIGTIIQSNVKDNGYYIRSKFTKVTTMQNFKIICKNFNVVGICIIWNYKQYGLMPYLQKLYTEIYNLYSCTN